MSFLRRSCAAFDSGEFDEAIRIALIVRVLVHNTRNSTSLLTHLGIQDALSYVDTGVYRHLLNGALQAWVDERAPGHTVAANNPADVGLVELGDAGGGRVGWYAPLRLRRFAPGTPPDQATRGTIGFDAWWSDPLVESSSGKSFSRSRLVLIMANQDGGGHVDAEIDADYSDLMVDHIMSAEHGQVVESRVVGGDVQKALHNVAFASVRQIAFELVCTIERYYWLKANPDALLLANPFALLSTPQPPHDPLNVPTPIILAKAVSD